MLRMLQLFIEILYAIFFKNTSPVLTRQYRQRTINLHPSDWISKSVGAFFFLDASRHIKRARSTGARMSRAALPVTAEVEARARLSFYVKSMPYPTNECIMANNGRGSRGIAINHDRPTRPHLSNRPAADRTQHRQPVAKSSAPRSESRREQPQDIAWNNSSRALHVAPAHRKNVTRASMHFHKFIPFIVRITT